MAKAQRRDGSLHAVARRTQALRDTRRNHRKLLHKDLPREPRYGPRSLPAPVSLERKRSGADRKPRPQATVPDQDAGTGEGRQPHRGRQKLLALHERSLRQQETERRIRNLRFRARPGSACWRAAVILLIPPGDWAAL